MSKRGLRFRGFGFWLVAAALVAMLAPAVAPAQGPAETELSGTEGSTQQAGAAEIAGGEEDPSGAGTGPSVTGAGPLEGGGIDLDERIDMSERLAVVVDGLDDWIGQGDDTWPDVRLVLNGKAIEDLQPLPPMRDLSALVFNLERFDRTENPAWDQLLQERRLFEAQANISVAFKGGKALPSKAEGRTLILLNAGLGWLAAVFAAIVIVALVWLAAKHGMLSDSGEKPAHGKKPYSLARCQTAWWFVLILCAYLFLCLITGATVTIPASVLGLMGIAAGTFVGAEVINANRDKPHPNPPSSGFLKDVLRNGGDVSFHRFQMFVWTLVVGAIFVIRVAKNLTMPDFDATLLGLMGLSSGTFLGMKIPEGAKEPSDVDAG